MKRNVMKTKIRHFLTKTAIFVKSYIELCIWLLVFAVGIRFFEFLLLTKIGYEFRLCFLWNATGLLNDMILFLRWGVWILIVFVAASFLNEKTTRLFFRILFSVMLLLSLIGIVFFSNAGFLLDKVVFTYSLKETIFIIQSSASSPVWVYIIMIMLPLLYLYLSGKRIRVNYVLVAAFGIVTVTSFFIISNISLQTNYNHTKTNKGYFFLKSLFKRTTPAFIENDEDIIKAVEEFRSYFPEHQFLEVEYPFLHQAKYQDVLSSFFNLNSEPPNLVFIIVEGLGNKYFNNQFQLMPFLDSLSKISLSWNNCLSVSSRTFGVLPAIFGAGPLGEKGFLDQSLFNPAHHTLLSILNQNNYSNYYFYGCKWLNFDNNDRFVEQNNMTHIKDNEWDEDIVYEKIDAFWGYEDHLTYQQALRMLNKEQKSPRVDVYLTLTTHPPYEYPRSSHFQEIVTNKVINNRELSEERKKNILKWIQFYGSFAYSDWALQQLFAGYKKRDDFENTIFIITGDHSASAGQFGGFSNYHVPLLIYSPMLKSGREMKGVVSHRDITPTFISLLKQNYNINTPKEVAWLNVALDTSLTFNANTFAPLQIIDHTIDGVLYKNYLLCEGILEELTDGASVKVSNPNVLQKMNRLLSLYKSLDLYALYNDALIKNNYAHRHKFKKTIINIEDTIANDSYFAIQSKLQVLEGPEGRNTTLYFDGSTKRPIYFLDFSIPKNIENFKVEIEFMIYVKKEEEKTIYIVSDIKKLNKTISKEADKLLPDKFNRWHKYQRTFLYKKDTFESFGDLSRYRLYISNGDQLEGYIDNIKVKVTVD